MLNLFLLAVADAAAAHLFLNSGFFLSLLWLFFFLFFLYERLLFFSWGVFSRGFITTFFLILFFHCGMYVL